MKQGRHVPQVRRHKGVSATNVFVSDQWRWQTEVGIWVWSGGTLYRAADWSAVATCGMTPVDDVPPLSIEGAIELSLELTSQVRAMMEAQGG